MTHIIYQLSQLTNIHVKNILKHTISIEQTVKLYHCSKLRGGSEKKLPLLVGCFQCICFLMKKTKNFYRALTPTNYTSLSIYIYGAPQCLPTAWTHKPNIQQYNVDHGRNIGCSMKFYHKPNSQQKSLHVTIVPTPRSIIMLTLHRLSNEIIPHSVKKCQHLVFWICFLI